VKFQQSPSGRKFIRTNQTARHKVKPLAPDSKFRFLSKGLGAVGEEVRSRDLALDQHRVTRPFPSDSIGHLAAHTSLLGKHYPAPVVTEPFDSLANQKCVCHSIQVLSSFVSKCRCGRKYLPGF
jgi:hypothetical protein